MRMRHLGDRSTGLNLVSAGLRSALPKVASGTAGGGNNCLALTGRLHEPPNVRTGIVIGLPMTTARYNETNPFAIRFVGPKGAVSYILGHQPKSFDWSARAGKPSIHRSTRCRNTRAPVSGI